MKKLILLLFLVIYGCGERKQEDISKKNIQKDSIQKEPTKISIAHKRLKINRNIEFLNKILNLEKL